MIVAMSLPGVTYTASVPAGRDVASGRATSAGADESSRFRSETTFMWLPVRETCHDERDLTRVPFSVRYSRMTLITEHDGVARRTLPPTLRPKDVMTPNFLQEQVCERCGRRLTEHAQFRVRWRRSKSGLL